MRAERDERFNSRPATCLPAILVGRLRSGARREALFLFDKTPMCMAWLGRIAGFLVAALLGLFLGAFITPHIAVDSGYGKCHRGVTVSLLFIGLDKAEEYCSFRVDFAGESPITWQWGDPESYPYQQLRMKWVAADEEKGAATIDLRSMTCQSKDNSGVFTREILKSWLLGKRCRSAGPNVNKAVDEVFHWIQDAGEGRLRRWGCDEFRVDAPNVEVREVYLGCRIKVTPLWGVIAVIGLAYWQFRRAYGLSWGAVDTVAWGPLAAIRTSIQSAIGWSIVIVVMVLLGNWLQVWPAKGHVPGIVEYFEWLLFRAADVFLLAMTWLAWYLPIRCFDGFGFRVLAASATLFAWASF